LHRDAPEDVCPFLSEQRRPRISIHNLFTSRNMRWDVQLLVFVPILWKGVQSLGLGFGI